MGMKYEILQNLFAGHEKLAFPLSPSLVFLFFQRLRNMNFNNGNNLHILDETNGKKALNEKISILKNVL